MTHNVSAHYKLRVVRFISHYFHFFEMEVSQDACEILRCGKCDDSGAGDQQEGGETREGAGWSRNVQYEALAQQHVFPCSFADQGCRQKMTFSAREPNAHERHCPFRTFLCPMEECDWTGSHRDLWQHCHDAHSDCVLENPCELPRMDLTRSHLCNYLVSAFNVLFLIHIKVCKASAKFWHALRFLGDPELLPKFSYSIEIGENRRKLIDNGSVLERGIMMLQEHTAISTSINSLLSVFSGRNEERKFTLKINTTLKFTCSNCAKEILSHSSLCNECQKLIKCNINGCNFMDVNSTKCVKHKDLFCKYQTRCSICCVNFVAGSFIEHLSSSTCLDKNFIKSNLNSIVRVTEFNYNLILLSSISFGTIVCCIKLLDSSLYISLKLSLPFHKLKNSKCSIEITDPVTKYKMIRTPKIQKNIVHDWLIKDERKKFPSVENIGIDVRINIV